MINSISKELYEVQIPSYNGEVKMLPFDLSNINNIPEQYKEVEYQLVGDEYYYPSELFRDIKEYRKQQIKKINESSLYK